MEARAQGWVISRHEAEPFKVPFFTPPQEWVLPDCEGNARKVWGGSMEDALIDFDIEERDAEVIPIEEGRR